jgi:O-antigen ligase
MVAYLLRAANSATSLVCLLVAIGVLLSSRMPLIRRDLRRVVTASAVAVVVLVILEMAFEISATAIAMLGRDPTLTTRVSMWAELLAMGTNPVIGVGFESFWLGDRVLGIWERYGRLIQAHNGYLEVYLNLGLVGVAILLAGMLSGLVKVRRHLETDRASGILRLCFVLVAILYNWTEATFVGVSNVWMLFLVGAMSVPPREAGAGIRAKPAPAFGQRPAARPLRYGGVRR